MKRAVVGPVSNPLAVVCLTSEAKIGSIGHMADEPKQPPSGSQAEGKQPARAPSEGYATEKPQRPLKYSQVQSVRKAGKGGKRA